MERDEETALLVRALGELNRRVAELSDRIEKFNLAEYLALFEHPGRLFWFNLLAGIGRGVGAALGFSLITGLIIYLLQRLIMLNLPVISDFLVNLIILIRQRGGF